MIPVDRNSSFYNKSERVHSLPPRAATIDALPTTAADSNHTATQSNDSNSPVMSPEEESRKSIDDFMGKIDSTLAKTRKYVAKSQHSVR